MAEIPAFDYDAYPLETKFAWMRSGNGGSASFDACDRLKQLAARLTESDQVVGRNMVRRRLGTQWEGSAASEAGAALDRTAATISAAAPRADFGAGGELGSFAIAQSLRHSASGAVWVDLRFGS